MLVQKIIDDLDKGQTGSGEPVAERCRRVATR